MQHKVEISSYSDYSHHVLPGVKIKGEYFPIQVEKKKTATRSIMCIFFQQENASVLVLACLKYGNPRSSKA